MRQKRLAWMLCVSSELRVRWRQCDRVGGICGDIDMKHFELLEEAVSRAARAVFNSASPGTAPRVGRHFSCTRME